MDLLADYLWLIIALPLAGAVALHFGGKFLPEPLPGLAAVGAIGTAFLIAAAAFIPLASGEAEPHILMLWDWMPGIGAAFEIRWDQLSALMTLIITGVGTLIHIYSIGYMHGDPRFSRFFTNLNLFAASMLTLVLANNYAMMFVGWELVGLCSYLLISICSPAHRRPPPARRPLLSTGSATSRSSSASCWFSRNSDPSRCPRPFWCTRVRCFHLVWPPPSPSCS